MGPADPAPHEPGWRQWLGRGVRLASPADINLERYVVRPLVVRHRYRPHPAFFSSPTELGQRTSHEQHSSCDRAWPIERIDSPCTGVGGCGQRLARNPGFATGFELGFRCLDEPCFVTATACRASSGDMPPPLAGRAPLEPPQKNHEKPYFSRTKWLSYRPGPATFSRRRGR